MNENISFFTCEKEENMERIIQDSNCSITSPVPKVFDVEYKFCLILWAHEPIKSKELVCLCQSQLGWKPTTTYTVIKRLSNRGVLRNENTVVRSIISKEDVQASEVNEFIQKRFDGSLSAFLKSYIRGHIQSEEEVQAVQKVIDLSRIVDCCDES